MDKYLIKYAYCGKLSLIFSKTDIRIVVLIQNNIIRALNTKFSENLFTEVTTVHVWLVGNSRKYRSKCSILTDKITQCKQRSLKERLLFFVAVDFNGAAGILWSWNRQLKVGNVSVLLIPTKLCFLWCLFACNSVCSCFWINPPPIILLKTV